MGLFRICEDLENVDGLHMLYKIVRGISKYSLYTTIHKVLHINRRIFYVLFFSNCVFSSCSSAE